MGHLLFQFRGPGSVPGLSILWTIFPEAPLKDSSRDEMEQQRLSEVISDGFLVKFETNLKHFDGYFGEF